MPNITIYSRWCVWAIKHALYSYIVIRRYRYEYCALYCAVVAVVDGDDGFPFFFSVLIFLALRVNARGFSTSCQKK